MWYHKRRQIALVKLKTIYVRLLSQCDVKEQILNQQPYLVIDFFVRIREHAAEVKKELQHRQSESHVHDDGIAYLSDLDQSSLQRLYEQLASQQEQLLAASPSLADSLQYFVA